MSTRSNNSGQTIAIVLAVIFFGVAAFLFYQNRQVKENLTQMEDRLDETFDLKEDLEAEYQEAITELDDMRTDNETLNTVIDQQKIELQQQKNKISKLLRENRDLNTARDELDKMKLQVNEYINEIDRLTEENAMLADDNLKLYKQNKNLSLDLTEQRVENEELSSAKEVLIEENESLSTEKERLSSKVIKASVIDVENVFVDGYALSSSGKEKRKKRADQVTKLKICFNATINEVAEEGIETFYLRLLKPGGETLSTENSGGGILHNRDSNQPMRYTQSITVDYTHEARPVCLDWSPNMSLQSGTYNVEVYNKGHLSGTGQFTLK